MLFTHNSRKFLNGSDLGVYQGSTVFRNGQWHVLIGQSLFKLNTDTPLSAELAGDSVLLHGVGVLESSPDLLHWAEFASLDGTARVSLVRTNRAQFFRLKIPSP